LALGISDAYVNDLGSDARIDGSMSGEIFYETPQPGSGHLEINLVCEQLRSAVPTADGGPRERTDLPRVDVSASLVITPQSIAAHEVVIATPQTTLRMSGMVARPLQSASMADLSLEFDDVEVSQAEITEYLIRQAPQYGMTPDQFAQAVAQAGQVGAIVGDVRRSKALSVVLEQAVVRDSAGNVVELFGNLAEVGNDPWLYSSTLAPTLVFSDVQFSGV